MSIHRPFHSWGAAIGLAAIATLAVVFLWQQWIHQKEFFEQPTVLANLALMEGLIAVWIAALAFHLWQQSDRYAQCINQINQHHRRLIQNLNVGFVIHGADTRILLCNQMACDLLGLSMAQMLGKQARDSTWHFIYEDGTVMPQEAYPVNRVLSTRSALKNYALGICKQGQPITWVLVNAFPELNAHQQVCQVVVTVMDISEQQAAMHERQRIEGERQQAEIALRQSEATKQAIIEAIPDLMIRMRADGTYLNFISNRRFQLANPQQSKVNATVYDVLPSHLAHLRMQYLTLALQTGHAQNYEHEIFIHQERFYEEVRIVPLAADEGLVIVRDMTARKRAELELQAQKNFLQQVVDAVPSSIFVKDVQGRFLIVNRAAAAIYGLSIEEMLGKQDQDINSDPQQSEVFQIQNHEVARHLLPLTFPDQAIANCQGQTRWYQTTMSPLLDGDGRLKGFIGNAVEVSDRKQAEEDLRHQKEMLQTIIDHIPVMLAQFNTDGQVELINLEAEKVLGWSLQDWQRQNILALCYPDPVYRQQVLEYIATADGTWHDWTTCTASGQTLETSWANVRLSDGRFLGIGQDVSDRKRRELALQQAMEAAEAANLAKSLFLANMSHELRTPLNVILGFAQVMAHDSNLTADQQEDLQTIHRSGDHLLNLINDVLDLSKIETGHSALEVTAIDLIALLHSLHHMLAERAASKGIHLTFEIAPEVPPLILADAQKLRQILLNLLGNALKFTHQGSITLQVSVVSIHSLAPDPNGNIPYHLQFDVIDTGSGIEQDELITIFDAFVQAQSGRQSSSGTGLGLTISRKLIELMGGSITVHSTLGQGSTFTVVLPVYPARESSASPQGGDRRLVVGLAPGQALRRILVVDDQPENRLLLVRLLAPLGVAVQEASNGEEAVRLWQEWQPDLTWMDIRMPGMDGYVATQQIRALEQESASIIIALTAQASQSDRTLALAAGCNDYISKPFCAETLFLKMQEYLGLEYSYAEPEAFSQYATASPTPPPLALPATLPPDWLQALEEASICGNDRTIAQLTTSLPPDQTKLAAYLVNLADQYQFERILQWLESIRTR